MRAGSFRAKLIRNLLMKGVLPWAFVAAGAMAAHGVGAPEPSSPQKSYKVSEQHIDDLKAVYATVRSKDRIEARVRTPGTVVSLKVEEGARVTAGQVLAVVVDPKLALRLKALDAQIVASKSRFEAAKLEYERNLQLRERGVVAQSRLDQVKTAYDVAVNELDAAKAERQVSLQQTAEGEVLAPAEGTVLRVPVTEGSVVMAGESIATIAANEYLLRLELPERHARFIKQGDAVQLGDRGQTAGALPYFKGEGRIVRVVPEIHGGRVLADAEVAGLDGYYVGERALVWISVGKRKSFVVPREFIERKFGLDYVRLASPPGEAPREIVVQLGLPSRLPDGREGVEVLAGLKSGDVILQPEVRP